MWHSMGMTNSQILEGDKVLGLGRNGHIWRNKPVGTVTAVLPSGDVRVQWHNCAVEDDMARDEVLPVYPDPVNGRWLTIPED